MQSVMAIPTYQSRRPCSHLLRSARGATVLRSDRAGFLRDRASAESLVYIPTLTLLMSPDILAIASGLSVKPAKIMGLTSHSFEQQTASMDRLENQRLHTCVVGELSWL